MNKTAVSMFFRWLLTDPVNVTPRANPGR